MTNFAGVADEFCSFDYAAVLLQSVPYDGTSTWIKGADRGFSAFLDALENMELYDIETGTEVYRKGVHILPQLKEDASPEAMFNEVYFKTKELLETGKYLTFFGGEHSISVGVIKAFYEKYDNLTVLQLDAHADLRPSYHGSSYNHACALYDASVNTNLIQVGIRSMDIEEVEHMDKSKTFFAENMYGTSDWMDQSIALMTDDVYLTIDLDAFDPGILPATGTPEPGGIDWNTMIRYLRKVFEQKNVVGFDIVELAPIEGNKASEFLVAKLYYKLLSYKFLNHGK
ncbi:agmatinase [Salibacteraceae bacterium]|jgi:agmatinase|nr:agmatinase [Salibacteraceae bacterium]MDA9267039.1 agmatinase [Salibacteraceae bacterium]MDC1220256.1 agmatinase [bacterium]HAQ72281.1 agmatinase [Flavobacteriales bacterium]